MKWAKWLKQKRFMTHPRQGGARHRRSADCLHHHHRRCCAGDTLDWGPVSFQCFTQIPTKIL